MTFKKFIQSLKNEEEGFSFGPPWRHSKKASIVIVPIIRNKRRLRGYLTLDEAKVKIEDTGQIDKALVENLDDEPVYINMGTLLEGKTQERAVTRSAIIMPGEKENIAIVCVHASEGIVGGAKFMGGNYVPSSISNCFYNNANQSEIWDNVEKYVKEAANNTGIKIKTKTIKEEQFKVAPAPKVGSVMEIGIGASTPKALWKSERPTGQSAGNMKSIKAKFVKREEAYSSELAFSSDSNEYKDIYEDENGKRIVQRACRQSIGHENIVTDDLASTAKEVAKAAKNIINKVPFHKNQVGFAMVDKEGCSLLETFNLAKSWKAVRDAVIRKEGDKVGKKDKTVKKKPEEAKKAIIECLSEDYKEKIAFENDNYKVITLSSKKYAGEATVFNDRTVHLAITRK